MIESLRLQKFRSYSDASFEFDNGVTIIVGPNASGKTNLLEAILVISTGKSYRVKDSELIMHKKPWARLDASVESGGRSLKLINHGDSTEKILEINKEVVKRLTAQKKLPIVLFEPNHLQLFHEGPEIRRDYMDELIEQLHPGFGQIRAHYRRTLAQRNRLLKQQPSGFEKQLFAWNIRLSELGGQIVTYRHELISKINTHLPDLYKTLSNTKTVAAASYASKLPLDQYSSALLHKLESSVETDSQRGFTGCGPHRDDMGITLDSHPILESASRGEIRTLLLVLKMIELKLFEESAGAKPLLLLDDVFSELDGARRRELTQAIKGYQTFITTTDADIVIHSFAQKCNVIVLESRAN